MNQQNTRLILVPLFDPTFCQSCRFAAIAAVEMADGTTRLMRHCKRRDCDNWQTDKKEPIPIVRRVTP